MKPSTILGIAGAVLLIGGGTYAFVTIRKKAKLNKDIKATDKGNIPSLGINTYSIAKQIGLDLGVAYPKYDPRRWTENDNEVMISVLKVPKTLINKLVTDYASIYKRNLKADLQELLDKDLYARVSYLFS